MIEQELNIEPIKSKEDSLFRDIKRILEDGRRHAYHAVNSAMVQTYWKIGQRIIEEEQNGAARAAYGKGLLKQLSEQLTEEFGKGLDERELRKNASVLYAISNLGHTASRIELVKDRRMSDD